VVLDALGRVTDEQQMRQGAWRKLLILLRFAGCGMVERAEVLAPYAARKAEIADAVGRYRRLEQVFSGHNDTELLELLQIVRSVASDIVDALVRYKTWTAEHGVPEWRSEESSDHLFYKRNVFNDIARARLWVGMLNIGAVKRYGLEPEGLVPAGGIWSLDAKATDAQVTDWACYLVLGLSA